MCASSGYPRTIWVDQGSAFVSRDLDLWAYVHGVMLDFSRPGKPTDNSYLGTFNGHFQAECLNAHWFLTLADAREQMEVRRRHYNEERPHGAIGDMAPIRQHNPDGAISPPSRRSWATLIPGGPNNGLGSPWDGLSPKPRDQEGGRSGALPVLIRAGKRPIDRSAASSRVVAIGRSVREKRMSDDGAIHDSMRRT